MQLSRKYVVVKKVTPPKKEGEFNVVEAQDDFVYKGEVTHLPGEPVWLSNKQLALGDIVLFAKYSPDTHEIEVEGEKRKFVSQEDLLAVL